MTDSQGDSAVSMDFENSRMLFEHQPVLLREILEAFEILEDGLFFDATIGGGGHADALLAAAPGRELVGVDRDKSAVEIASSRVK